MIHSLWRNEKSASQFIPWALGTFESTFIKKFQSLITHRWFHWRQRLKNRTYGGNFFSAHLSSFNRFWICNLTLARRIHAESTDFPVITYTFARILYFSFHHFLLCFFLNISFPRTRLHFRISFNIRSIMLLRVKRLLRPRLKGFFFFGVRLWFCVALKPHIR